MIELMILPQGTLDETTTLRLIADLELSLRAFLLKITLSEAILSTNPKGVLCFLR